MASQPIRGCKTHTTNLADRTCDDDLFSFISKKSHENRWLFLIKNVQNGCFLLALYVHYSACKNRDNEWSLQFYNVWDLLYPTPKTLKKMIVELYLSSDPNIVQNYYIPRLKP